MSAHTLQNCFANWLSIDINDADVQTGEKSEIKYDAIFIAIGHKPNT
jgi:thioredoxin reductase